MSKDEENKKSFVTVRIIEQGNLIECGSCGCTLKYGDVAYFIEEVMLVAIDNGDCKLEPSGYSEVTCHSCRTKEMVVSYG